MDSEQNQASVDKCCPASESMILKRGARVMLLKNLDPANNLVNGTQGVVEGFTGTGSLTESGKSISVKLDPNERCRILPIVSFPSVKKLKINPETWFIKPKASMHTEDIISLRATLPSRTQIPLSLSWAISIHKSQGMSLQGIEMDPLESF